MLPLSQEEPSFPLISIPDAELNEEDLKEKRKQKLYKAGYDARMRMKAEKLAEKAKLVSTSFAHPYGDVIDTFRRLRR